MNSLSAMWLALLLSVTLSAPRSPSAETVAHALEAHYQRMKTMAAVFLEKYTSGGSSIRAESGRVYFSRPGRMRWDYDSPEPKLFLVDGKHVWYYVPADHTASRTSINDSDDWRTPLALLAGKVKLARLCGGLQLSHSGTTTDAELRPTQPGDSVLICSPRKGDEDAFRQLILEVN